MPESVFDYYFDTVTLCNFALAKRFDLVRVRYGSRAQITSAVLEEIAGGIVAGYGGLQEIEDAVTAGRVGQAGILNGREREIFRSLLHTLAPGEASCIACAQSRGGIVVTDDKAARDCCLERDVKFTGTIGILKACCRDGLILPQEADGVLQAMIEAGYFSPVRNISGLL
ncbi:MAG: hypothetical protein O2954_11175 [bacterium]|nr:hypothetical protein [bacterium]